MVDNMAVTSKSFAGSLVFIYDKDNTLITKTSIASHNRVENYIEVARGLENVKLKSPLQLMIIHSGGTSEVSGTLKGFRQGLYEISIYNERKKDDRSKLRRTLNVDAIISEMFIDSVSKKPEEPIQIIIENLSTTGLLLRTATRRFDIGTFLQIEMKLFGKDVILFAEIVRQEVKEDQQKYGCKLCFLE